MGGFPVPGGGGGVAAELLLPAAFVAAVLVAFALGYGRPLLQRRQAHRKRQALELHARQHGWRFAPGDDERVNAFEPDFALLRGVRGEYGRVEGEGSVELDREDGRFKLSVRDDLPERARRRMQRRCRNVVDLERDGIALTFLDLFWVEHSRSHDGDVSREHTHRRQRGIALARLPVALPHLRVWPRGPLARVFREVGLARVVSGRDDVDRNLLVLSAEPEAAAALLASPAVDVLAEADFLCWEVSPRRGHVLLVDQPRVWALDDYERLAEVIARFVAAAPAHLLRPRDDHGEATRQAPTAG